MYRLPEFRTGSARPGQWLQIERITVCKCFIALEEKRGKYRIRSFQLNLVSGHLDLSVVYGKTVEKANAMRAFSGGCFNLSYSQCMPKGPAGIMTGDGRATQTTWLAICHSMWYTLHNYIAKGLAACNRHWNDQRLFEEARRITIACYERIIYYEWLPTFLSKLPWNPAITWSPCMKSICFLRSRLLPTEEFNVR